MTGTRDSDVPDDSTHPAGDDPGLPPIADRVAAPAAAVRPTDDLGLTWRPATPADVPAWFEMLQHTEATDQPGERHELSDLAGEFEASWADPENDSLLGLDDQGRVQAFGWAQMRPNDATVAQVHLWGGVHPDWRGRGIGRQLMAWLEARGRQLLAESGKDLPARISTDIGLTNTAGIGLTHEMGFIKARTFADVRRDLSQPIPSVEVPEGFRLVTYDDSLESALLVSHNEAFGDHWGTQPRTVEDWRKIAVKNRAFKPEWSFVLLDGDTVAAYTISMAYPEKWQAQGYREGWTGWLGVAKDYRGRRLAPALLTAAMSAFADAGLEWAGLEVDIANPSGAHNLYASLGYTEVRAKSTMAKEF